MLTFYLIAAKRLGRREVAEERIPEGTKLRKYSTSLWVSELCVLTLIPAQGRAVGNGAAKKQGVGTPEPGSPLQPRPQHSALQLMVNRTVRLISSHSFSHLHTRVCVHVCVYVNVCTHTQTWIHTSVVFLRINHLRIFILRDFL